MMDYFNAMDPMLRTFWFVALPASLFFVIQTLMTFIGADASDGVDADFDSDLQGESAPFQLFSLRNLVNFMMGFGWTGLSLYNDIENRVLLVTIATIVGAGFVYMFFVIIRNLMKLSENNSFKIQHTVGQMAEVYLKIPGNKAGRGKVQISVRGSYHELDAMTEGEEIPTGATVKVNKVESGNILFVTKL